jgi:sulfite reductase (ferredoxin)
MKASNSLWKEHLGARTPEHLEAEIDVFENEIALRRQGKIDERVFAETRLRRGVYGQRYDNGHRNDGIRAQELRYPNGGLNKGPETLWDAPGMQRVKIPFGGLTPDQMDVLADLAEGLIRGCIDHFGDPVRVIREDLPGPPGTAARFAIVPVR